MVTDVVPWEVQEQRIEGGENGNRVPLTHPVIILFHVLMLAGGCRTSVSEQKSNSHTNSSSKKVEVIDLTLDSSSEDEEDEEPPQKRSCPSLSPTSPQMNKG